MSTPAGTLIELFELDASSVGAGIYRFHSGVNEFSGNVVWQGNTYTAFPVEATGFDMVGNGQLPRPTLRISNVDQTIGALVRQYDDLVGCKFTRRRVFAKYLDAVNFVSGNPLADPAAEFPHDIFIIERKVVENKVVIEFEMVSAVDMQNVFLPKRQLKPFFCSWIYKGPECGYVGALPTCDKGLGTSNGCKAHFGATAELPFEGEPGCGLRRS